MTAPDDTYIPDAVAEACLPAWNEQACNAGVHDNCDPDCPYDRPAQALRIAWRAVLASGAARAALLAALGHTDCVPHGDYDAVLTSNRCLRDRAERAEASLAAQKAYREAERDRAERAEAERDRYREAIADALQHPGDARAMARRLRTVREDMRLTIPGCTCGGAGRDEAYHDLHYEGCAALDGGERDE